MEPETLKVFLQYGLLGAVALMAMWIARYLYLAREKLRTEYDAKLVEQETRHREDIKALYERHSVKAETWMNQALASGDSKDDALAAHRELITKLLDALKKMSED